MKRVGQKRRSDGGFTLIELLAAMTILILIVLIASGMTIYILTGSNIVQRRAESDTQGRGFTSRIAYDLLTVVHNQNVPLVVNPSSGSAINPGVAFVCASRSPNTTSTSTRSSVVYYQIGTPSGDTQASLLRGCAPIFWASTDGSPYDPSTALASAATAMSGGGVSGFTSAPDVVPVGAGIVRITYVLTLLNGTSIPLNTAATGFPVLSTFTPTLPTGYVAVDLSQVRAITIGIAVLDSASQRSVTTPQLQSLVNAIPEPAAGQKPLDVWSVQNSSIQAALNTLPLPIRANLRFYQQTVLVP